jgi:hypothetical protein
MAFPMRLSQSRNISLISADAMHVAHNRDPRTRRRNSFDKTVSSHLDHFSAPRVKSGVRIFNHGGGIQRVPVEKSSTKGCGQKRSRKLAGSEKQRGRS